MLLSTGSVFLAGALLRGNTLFRKNATIHRPISGGSRISHRGGMDLVGGDMDSRGSYISKILYVKTKELGPLGGVHPPRSANANVVLSSITED